MRNLALLMVVKNMLRGRSVGGISRSANLGLLFVHQALALFHVLRPLGAPFFVVLAALVAETTPVSPVLTGRTVNPDRPTRLGIVQPLFHQAKVELALGR